MPIDRRTFLAGSAGVAGLVRLTSGASSPAPSPARGPRTKAIAFDGFPIIDPRPIEAAAEALFPAKGETLMKAWRTRQFEYTWLRTLSGRYTDFWAVTQEALTFAAESLGLSLDDSSRTQLMDTHLRLEAWPDARPALEALQAAGVRLRFLSNLTASMLDAAVKNAGLQGFFEGHLSTDRVRAFKPDPRAYRMGLEAFDALREEIVFCASAGWDAAGARWFGYPTFWVNRARQPAEQLGVQADGMGAGLADLVNFVINRR